MSDHVSVCSQVKWLYNQYAKDVPPYKGSVPEYPTWFESSVMQWLNENDDVSLEYLNGAFARDKKDGVSILGTALLFDVVSPWIVSLNRRPSADTRKWHHSAFALKDVPIVQVAAEQRRR